MLDTKHTNESTMKDKQKEINRLRKVLMSISNSRPDHLLDLEKNPELVRWICDTCELARSESYNVDDTSTKKLSNWFRKYRIVEDGSLGYESQVKYLFLPWKKIMLSSASIEAARKNCRIHAGIVVENL
jgi:hypothetical protein